MRGKRGGKSTFLIFYGNLIQNRESVELKSSLRVARLLGING
jgi:hypothetical protein